MYHYLFHFRYPESTHSERGRRLRTALSVADSIDEAKKLVLRQRAQEKRNEQEKERKKAIKAAKRRQKEARLKKNVSFKVEFREEMLGRNLCIYNLIYRRLFHFIKVHL